MELSLPWNNLEGAGASDSSGPDDRSGRVYRINDALKLAIETALVIGRPLLLLGSPGSGKSSLAAFVARNLNWRYYEYSLQRRSNCKDLLWRFDALSRLRDAQAGEPLTSMTVEKYLTPGVLWWAINRGDALNCIEERKISGGSSLKEPFADTNKDRDPDRAVVLVDEIDKTDPDVPGDMLDMLSLYRFTVEENGHQVIRKSSNRTDQVTDLKKANGPLIVFTSNQDRDLPPAFVRRCVIHRIEVADSQQLVEIARLHLGSDRFAEFQSLAESIAAKCLQLANERRNEPQVLGFSVAEYLDTLYACINLGIQVDESDPTWNWIVSCSLAKTL